jgi:(S)-2-hydroxyglutarate dehydrogenase
LLNQYYDIAIIGGGILGASIAYFVSAFSSNSVILVEKELEVASHASNRNTGKVHAPFLYDPIHKRMFAKAAFLGFQMVLDYCKLSHLPFIPDGVISVATHDKGIDALHKYLEWGFENGLQRNELLFLDGSMISKFEPRVRCISAIYCTRDASVNYGAITRQLVLDAHQFGCRVVTGMRVANISSNNMKLELQLVSHNPGAKANSSSNVRPYYAEDDLAINQPNESPTHELDNPNKNTDMKIYANYLINVAGGGALDIAHLMHVGHKYTNLYFRGEYWRAPKEYENFTKLSIYSVPKFPEYPFLDPHWIVRFDGSSEVGPNAVPVFGAYSYDWKNNIRFSIPKIIEIAKNSGIVKLLFNRQFMSLLNKEFMSSLSKTTMINRVREFLPDIKPSLFVTRGTAGIRSLLVDSSGNFMPDMVEIRNEKSLHILNYNSPGATGALPISATIVSRLLREGVLIPKNHSESVNRKDNWDINQIDSEIMNP